MPYPIVVGRERRTILNPLSQDTIERCVDRCVYLINVGDVQFSCQRSYGAYVIKARENERYSVHQITGRVEQIDQGDNKSVQQLTDCDAIAADLASECNEHILSLEGVPSFVGVFVSNTMRPSKDALEHAENRLLEFCRGQVQLADRFWDDPKTHGEITSLMRKAAKRLNLSKPWTYEPTAQILCEGCGESLRAGVAVCKTCGAVADEAKARRLFPDRFAHETAKAQEATKS